MLQPASGQPVADSAGNLFFPDGGMITADGTVIAPGGAVESTGIGNFTSFAGWQLLSLIPWWAWLIIAFVLYRTLR